MNARNRELASGEWPNSSAMDIYRYNVDNEVSLSLAKIAHQRSLHENEDTADRISIDSRITAEMVDSILQTRTDISAEDLTVILTDAIKQPPSRAAIDWNPDYGLGLFKLSAILGEKPDVLAQQLQNELSQKADSAIHRAEAVGPYLNVQVKDRALVNGIEHIAKAGAEFGKSPKKHEVAIVDFSSPNMAKPFGVNHLRSTVLGESIARLMEADGYIIVRDNHVGDWGTQFGNLLAAHEMYSSNVPFEKLSVEDLNELYVRFSQDKREFPELTLKGRQYFWRLNEKEAGLIEMWYQALQKSREEFSRVYSRLGVNFDTQIGEAYFEDSATKMIEDLKDSQIDGLSIKQDGAAYIEEEGQPVVLRTAEPHSYPLYAARDLPTITFRLETYDPSIILYVVGQEQILSFNAVFRIAKEAGLNVHNGNVADLEHISFGLLLDAEGKKLSTRKGTSGRLEDVISELDDRTVAEIKQRNPAMSEDDVLMNAYSLSTAALIWNDLRTERKRDVKFDFDKMLEFGDGSVVDILYSYVRTKHILDKFASEAEENASRPSEFTTNTEHELALRLNQLPTVIKKAADGRAPHILVAYLHEISQLHGSFYKESRVLGEEDKEAQAIRVALHNAYKTVVENGLRLLNINPPTRL